MESTKRRSSIQIYRCCSLDSLVEAFEALKPSRAGDIKLIMPRGITQFPFRRFRSLPDATQLVLTPNPHFSLSSSSSWVVQYTLSSDVSQCDVCFILSWLLGDFVSAEARRWEGKAVGRLPRGFFFFLDWRDLFLMKTEQGRSGSEAIYFCEKPEGQVTQWGSHSAKAHIGFRGAGGTV